MKNKTVTKILFLSLILSSCGLIERFKTPEQPTDSKDSPTETTSDEASASTVENAENAENIDDLFSKTMEETSTSQPASGSDAPTNITTDSSLKSLEDEFSSPENKRANQEAPVLVEETLPVIKTEVETSADNEAGEIKSYRVQRGETLMQIAFKLYGDISKWKEIKNMNSEKLSINASLKTNTELKYKAPSTPFVWNPTGLPHMIKTGETLGTISNLLYSTPKKWKAIWENNRPLINNPNVIYAGFTLYYKNEGMANFVQPKGQQPRKEMMAREQANTQASDVMVEEVLVQDEIATIPKKEVISLQKEEQMDEAIQTLSAPERKEAAVRAAIEKTQRTPTIEQEIDLINNLSAPQNQEIAPDIDEELQTL